MKRIVVVCVFVMSVASVLAAQKANETRDREVLLKLTDEITNVKIKRDIAALDRLLADEYIITNPAGFVANKTEYLEGARADTATYESATNYDHVVNLYGTTAVVAGASRVKGRHDGHDIGGQFRFTHMFVKRQDRWQVVATQLTRIAQQ